MNKNKFVAGIFGLGALVTPVFATIACSKVLSNTTTEIDKMSKLSSAQARVEKDYQEILLINLNNKPDSNGKPVVQFDPRTSKSLYNSHILLKDETGKDKVTEIKELLTYFLESKTVASATYLSQIASSLLNQDNSIMTDSLKENGNSGTNFDPIPEGQSQSVPGKISTPDVQKFFLLDKIPQNGVAKIFLPANAKALEVFEQLLLFSNLNSFKNEFYRFLISLKYMDASKADWDKVFHNEVSDELYRSYGPIDTDISDKDFVITKEISNLHPFFTWTTTLTEKDSASFVTQPKFKDIAEADGWLRKGNTDAQAKSFYDLIPYSAQRKTYDTIYKPLIDDINAVDSNKNKIDDLIAYTGLTSRTASTSGSLSFSYDEMRKAAESPDPSDATKTISKEANYTSAYLGYVYNSNIKPKNIPLFENGAKTVVLTRIAGIMPTFNNGSFSMELFTKSAEDKLALKEVVYNLDAKNIYDDAVSFYSNRTSDEGQTNLKPIKLYIENSYMYDLANDTFGYKYVTNVKDQGTIIKWD